MQVFEITSRRPQASRQLKPLAELKSGKLAFHVNFTHTPFGHLLTFIFRRFRATNQLGSSQFVTEAEILETISKERLSDQRAEAKNRAVLVEKEMEEDSPLYGYLLVHRLFIIQ